MSKTANELKYLAEKYGWKTGPLTQGQIQRMGSDEADFQSKLNKAEFEKALAAPRVKAENAKNLEAAKSQRMWADQANEEEIQESISEVQKFCQAYPQFVGSYVPNREALISFLREKNLACVKANLVTAFEDLASKGRIVLNPSALGIGTESEISGQRVVRHPELYKLLAPAPNAEQQKKIEEQKMSAKDWKEAHKEDFKPEGSAPFAVRAVSQAITTFRLAQPTYLPTEENQKKMENFLTANGLLWNPQGLQAAFNYLASRGELELSESNVIEGQASRYTNLGGSAPGFPPKSDKYSFQKKISSMGSQEYLDRINNDPEFRQAVNALG